MWIVINKGKRWMDGDRSIYDPVTQTTNSNRTRGPEDKNGMD